MKIRQRKHRSGEISWQVDLGMVDGKRHQKLYESETEAKRELAKAKAAKSKHGKTGMILTVAEMADVITARDRLQSVGATLTQAVEDYLARHGEVKESVLLAKLSERFRDSRLDLELSERYRRQLKVSLGSLVKLYPEMQTEDLRRSHIETWLGARGWGLKTRVNYLGDVRAMFSWAIAQKLAARSPCDGISLNKKVLREGEIERLPVAACEDLLKACRGRQDLMVYLVLAMFGGIRPAEIERMDWSMLDLDAGEQMATVGARHAKTRKKRVVDLTANAIAWISSCGEPGEGKICGKGFASRWAVLRRSLGWKVGAVRKDVHVTRGKWPHDALRHTYASMHYAQHQNEHALQAQMGHESADMLHTHYRGLVKRSEAALFWALKP